jgi:hypothetical protein
MLLLPTATAAVTTATVGLGVHSVKVHEQVLGMRGAYEMCSKEAGVERSKRVRDLEDIDIFGKQILSLHA